MTDWQKKCRTCGKELLSMTPSGIVNNSSGKSFTEFGSYSVLLCLNDPIEQGSERKSGV